MGIDSKVTLNKYLKVLCIDRLCKIAPCTVKLAGMSTVLNLKYQQHITSSRFQWWWWWSEANLICGSSHSLWIYLTKSAESRRFNVGSADFRVGHARLFTSHTTERTPGVTSQVEIMYRPDFYRSDLVKSRRMLYCLLYHALRTSYCTGVCRTGPCLHSRSVRP